MLRVAFLAALLVPALVQAQLTCTQSLHAAGSVKGGTVLTHTFALENTGTETLRITEVRTGCGCVRTQPAQRLLRAGEKTTLPLQVHTVTQAAGANQWGAELRYRTESGTEGVCTVRLSATVVPEVQLSPATLVLHTAAHARHPFFLSERRAEPLELTGVATSSPHVKAEAGKPVRQGNAWVREIRLTVAPTCPPGRQECTLTLTTGDAGFPELRAPFVVIKREEASVQAGPAEHDWLAVGSEALPARLSRLFTDSNQPITIDAIECSHPAFKATWASGPRATVRFVVDRDKVPAGGVEAVAEVKISTPKATTLKLPLRVRVK
jgi:hypothetical protein